MKEVFLLSITWLICKRDEAAFVDDHVSVGTCLTDLTMMCPAHQTGKTAQA